jgi:AcrR family transcriptional regulator
MLRQHILASRDGKQMFKTLDTVHKNKIDPRVVRTRRLLLDSFTVLLDRYKAIRAISVQSIAEEAGVNRATFYAHFTDKYELMAIWKRELFREALVSKLLDNQNAENVSFEQLIDTVLEFMISYRRYFRRVNRQYEPLFEAVLQQELKTVISAILEKSSHQQEPETATFLSWAIFGSANEWSRELKDQSKKDITKQLLTLTNLVAR